MEMQGLKPSVLMGKLKQHLPPGVSPDNDLFLAMLLICFPPSMRETEGAGAHGMAAAMVKAADALWDARADHDPTVAAAWTQRRRSPLTAAGREATKGAVTPAPKVAPPSHPDFHYFQNSGNGMCKFHNYYANRANRCILPCSWSENKFTARPLSVRRFFPHMSLPWLCIFLQTLAGCFWLMNWPMIGICLILEQLWALFLDPKFKPIWPPSWRGRWPTHPLLGFIQKAVQFQGKLFTWTFLQALVAGPILSIFFLKRNS